MEIIDRDALGVERASPEVFNEPGFAEGWNAMLGIIQAAEPVNAKPIMHAYWVKGADGGTECSHCQKGMRVMVGGKERKLNLSEMPYCPQCGASMDADADWIGDDAPCS